MTPCELWDVQSPARRPHRLGPEVPMRDAPSQGERSWLDAVNESAVSATVGDRFTTTASAEVIVSWIRRLSHHHMTPCGLWDAQTPARRPHRLSSRGSDAKSSWTLAAAADNTPGGAVTVTTSAEVVGSSIGRLSHHRMISSNVCDGLELVRRRHNGCVIMEPLFRALARRRWRPGVN